MTLFELMAVLSLDSSGFGKGLSTAQTMLKSFTVKAADATGRLIKNMVKTGYEYNKEIETLTMSFTTMTGSADKANEVVERLKKMGAETPFETSDLAKTTQLLMQYGFTADDAVDKMRMLGDISQGNAQAMNSVATGYAQMHSAGKVNLQDIKQMINAGFNPLQEISERTGESMSSLYDRISKGKMSVDEITASMEYATSEGGKFYRSMENQSKTLNGQISTLSENFKGFTGELISPFTDQLQQKILPELNESMTEIYDALFDDNALDVSPWNKFAEAAGNVATGAIDKLKNVLLWMIDNGDAVNTGLTVIAGGFATIFAVTHPAVTAVATVAATVTAFVAQWDSDKSVFENVKDISGGIATTIIDGGLKAVGVTGYREWAADTETSIVNTFNNIKSSISNAASAIGDFFTVSVPEVFKSAIDWIVSAFNTAKSAISTATGAINNFFSVKVGGALMSALNAVRSAITAISNAAKSAYEWIKTLLLSTPSINSSLSSSAGKFNMGKLPGRAVGIDYVPYNGYTAMLHEGEMVLTKLEAQRFRKNEEQGLNATSGSHGASASEIAAAVASALSSIGINIDGKRAGRLMQKQNMIAQNAYNRSIAQGVGL